MVSLKTDDQIVDPRMDVHDPRMPLVQRYMIKYSPSIHKGICAHMVHARGGWLGKGAGGDRYRAVPVVYRMYGRLATGARRTTDENDRSVTRHQLGRSVASGQHAL